MTWTIPNILTVARIAITPVIAALPFISGYTPKVAALVIFVAASVTDVIDGRLARRRNQVTDLGKKLDPIADKLLLIATLIPIWYITQQRQDLYGIPVWGSIPLWVCVLLLGREFAMTGFRWWAARRGVVIAAQGPGKLKTVFQSIFIGGTIAWFAYRDALRPLGWEGERAARWWNQFHGGFVAVTLAIALLLTIYSFIIYLYRYRGLFTQHGR
ncbi:MAG: CDP-diacylglycerol--glycerol-3-phosphate 3-phosphatidyltransferase [Gemmatimonadales bacterium]